MSPSTVLGIFKYYSIKKSKTLASVEFIFWLEKPKMHKLTEHTMSGYKFCEQKHSSVIEKEE